MKDILTMLGVFLLVWFSLGVYYERRENDNSQLITNTGFAYATAKTGIFYIGQAGDTEIKYASRTWSFPE